MYILVLLFELKYMLWRKRRDYTLFVFEYNKLIFECVHMSVSEYAQNYWSPIKYVQIVSDIDRKNLICSSATIIIYFGNLVCFYMAKYYSQFADNWITYVSLLIIVSLILNLMT